MTFKRGTFKVAVNPRHPTISMDDGQRNGWISGHFAIHGNKYGYTITHLPTGLIAGQTDKLARAKQAALEISQVPAVDWASTDGSKLLSDETAKDMMREITARYKDNR